MAVPRGQTFWNRGVPFPAQGLARLLFCLQLAVVLLSLSPPPVQSLMLKGHCKDNCEKHRPRGHTGAYDLNCNMLESGSKGCIDSCNDCPSSVCIPPDDHIHHCPEADFDPKCNEFCTTYGGLFKSSLVKCRNLPVPSECDVCSSLKCPSSLCNVVDNHNNSFWYCLKKSEPLCKMNCAIMRRDHLVLDFEPLDFNCDDMSYPESEQCVKDCKNSCSPETCDPKVDAKVYNCPAFGPFPTDPEPPPKDRCLARCDKYRLAGTDSYNLKCGENVNCKADCETCPKSCKVTSIDGVSGGAKIPVLNCPAAPGATNAKEEARQLAIIIIISVFVGLIVLLILFSVLIYYRIKKKRERKRERENAIAALEAAAIAAGLNLEEEEEEEEQSMDPVNYRMMRHSLAKRMSAAAPTDPAMLALIAKSQELEDEEDDDMF